MKLIKLFFISILLISPTLSFAENDLSISINPNSPSPYEKVSVSIQSYSINLSLADISWIVSGKQVSRGIGNKNIALTAGGMGSSLPITARVITSQGEVFESKINVTPESVDLVWETPESYVPPFYEGKSLPGEGAMVNVTAVPTMSDGGKSVSPENLSYSWYVNDNLMDNSSGFGKQATLIPLDYLSSKTDIKVVVQSANGTTAEKSISIYPHDVMPVFYTYDDILGVNMSSSINRRLETTRDFNLFVSPYYLSTNGALQNFSSFLWLLNGLPITPRENNLLAFHPKDNDVGTKNLSVIVNNTKRKLQKAQADLEILFDTRK